MQNNSNTGNSFTYRTFDHTTTYTLQAGDHLEFDVFLDGNNPVNNGGFDAVLSTSGTVRDTSGWVDQNGYSIHLATVLPTIDKGVWYFRSFDMTSKAGQTLSNFKIAREGDAAGYYVILLKNIRITHNGVDVKDIYQGGFPSANLQAEGPASGIAFQTTSRAISYYYEGSQRVALRRAGYTTSNGVAWLLSDQLDSTTEVIDKNGTIVSEQLYKPFGESRSTTGTLPTKYQYTGQLSDSSIGLYYYNARWYDTSLGRWASPDSVVQNPSNSQDWDRYSYVHNSPVVYNDPSGHCPFCIIIAIAIIAAIIIPWTSGDTCHTCNAANPVTPEQFKTDVTQRLNESADILSAATIVAGAGQALSPNTAPADQVGNDVADDLSNSPTGNNLSETNATTAIQSYYPPNKGFAGSPQVTTLQPGTLVQRYGSTYGQYLSPAGTPSWATVLPPNAIDQTLNTYQVAKPIENVLSGTAAPYWGQIGGGVQYYVGTPYGQNVQSLLNSGHLIPN